MREVDVVVVGAGPAGEVCAGRLADAGLEVVVVERELVGGECSYWACMPSKALLRAPGLLAEVERVPGAAQAVTGALDVQAVLDRRDEVVHDVDDAAQLPWLEDKGIGLVRGAARFTGERELQVGDEALRARQAVVVATGSLAAIPPVEGLREARPWTNREATTAKQVPARLAIIGGGVVAVEMAQAYAAFGSQVHMLVREDRLLEREEPFVCQQVADGLRDAGVHLDFETSATRVERRADGTVHLELEGHHGTLDVDEVLVATGRTPRTDDLGLEALGLEPGGYLRTDDQLRVAGHDWLYAIGDVNGRQLLTHMGKYQARVAADVIRGRDVRLRPVTSDAPPPRVVFTEPQVAAVGHTLESAKAAGLDVRHADVGTGANAGGSFVGKDAPGTSRLVVERGSDVVVGATFTGAEVQELLHAATIAVTSGLTVEELWHATPAFPTRNELWLNLVEALEAG
ncbi:NAD(P)/FAD-dependent oxidoreductase [Conexibacter sp. SYSU D00693]|uniref:dihydrolipoyl dehydrogenase family protein n=1 Tax=Conexibacter sp. SYSU D00693 TaxID=2812560 RepID=UPI00196B132C|nr:NAD(P)/FAD-dependent oxidoreductase [Conexibacter sp. SYSU D00693]